MQGSSKEEMVWYFAYGSNLSMSQMLARVGEWRTSRKAVLKGWKLVFNVQSPYWDGKTANIVQTNNPKDIVYGAIYEITKQKLSVLTEYEHKDSLDIEVESEESKIHAKAYVFKGTESARPPKPYLETIMSGLRQHGYEEDRADHVRRIADPRTEK
jgi:cation transport regulator ChaC